MFGSYSFGSPSMVGGNNVNNLFTPKPFGVNTGGSVFGGTSTGVFGQQLTSTSGFAISTTPASSSPVFGGQSPATQTQFPSIFGGGTTQPEFGQTQPASGFGSTGSTFGTTQPASGFGTTGSTFGQTQPASGFGTIGSTFGQTQPASGFGTTGSTFGPTQNTFRVQNPRNGNQFSSPPSISFTFGVKDKGSRVSSYKQTTTTKGKPYSMQRML